MTTRKIIRKKFTFAGSVQGVGFRYRAYHIANELSLTGWVHNEWDGTVTMEVQGEESSIEEMINRIQHRTFNFIDKIESQILLPDETERSFEIR